MGSFITPIMVGRREELNQLENALATVQGGAGRCVLLNGEAGIGKSRLLTEIQDQATNRGFIAMVDAIVTLYQNAGLRNFAVQLSPTAQPSVLPAWLEAHGLPRRDNWAKVYRGVEPPPMIRTDLRLECIGPEHAAAFASVACTAFGMPDTLRPWLVALVGRPGWRHYLAWDGAVPVATGALLTLLGPGGIGKTRLAIQVAGEVAGNFE